MSREWLFGPWLTPELYPERLLIQAVSLTAEGSGFTDCEVRPPAARFCVRVEGDLTSARRQLLELLTTATRLAIEQKLSSP